MATLKIAVLPAVPLVYCSFHCLADRSPEFLRIELLFAEKVEGLELPKGPALSLHRSMAGNHDYPSRILLLPNFGQQNQPVLVRLIGFDQAHIQDRQIEVFALLDLLPRLRNRANGYDLVAFALQQSA